MLYLILIIVFLIPFISTVHACMKRVINNQAFFAQIQKLVMANNIDRAIKLCNAAPEAGVPRVTRDLLVRANKDVEEIEREARSGHSAILRVVDELKTPQTIKAWGVKFLNVLTVGFFAMIAAGDLGVAQMIWPAIIAFLLYIGDVIGLRYLQMNFLEAVRLYDKLEGQLIARRQGQELQRARNTY